MTLQDLSLLFTEGMSIRLSPDSGDEVTALLVNNLLRQEGELFHVIDAREVI